MNWFEKMAAFLVKGRSAPGPVTKAVGLTADNGAADAAYREGLIAFQQQDYAAASRCFASAVGLRHDSADAHHYLGLTHLKQEQYEDAADCFAMAVHFRPDFAEAYYHLALASQRRNDPAAAAGYLERALALRSDYGDAHNALGAVSLELGDISRAVAQFERAVKLCPQNAKAHSNLGYVLFRDLGEYERGAAHISRALELDPGDANAWCNYSMVLSQQGRLDEAISVCDQLLSAKPEMHEARLNRGLARLKQGRFTEGWRDYEARKLTRSNYVPRPFGFPEWRGEPLRGKTVLVYAEQGLGDEIMFASCVPEVLARAGRCLIECAPRLERLMQRSFPGAKVHGSAQDDPDMGWLVEHEPLDYQVAIGSLPGFFRRHAADFPVHRGYLRADDILVAEWQARLAALGPGIRVGISWRGGMVSTRRELRSTPLAEWLPLLRQPACRFVSLQYGDCAEEVAALTREHGVRLHHWQQGIDDLDQMAALLCALDVVISVQTAVVHLSGALGRPTWVLIPAAPEWRYLQEGTTVPWYSSVRLFRQQEAGNWRPVLHLVADELERLAAAP